MKTPTILTKALPVTLVLSLFAGTVHAQKKPAPEELNTDVEISLSGTIAEIKGEDEFILQYNNGRIDVDTNDEAHRMFREKHADEVLAQGDKVIVTGQVDDNFFTGKEIDAVVIEHKGITYVSQTLARDVNATILSDWYRDYEEPSRVTKPLEEGKARITGTVNRVHSSGAFSLEYDNGQIEVVLPQENFPEEADVSVGDRLAVFGTINDELWFTNKKIEADRLVKLSNAKRFE